MVFHQDFRQRLPFGLRNYVKVGLDGLNRPDPTGGLTPLCAAVARGDADDVQQLLRKGVAADTPCRDGRTPLLHAASGDIKNRAWIIQLLLAKIPSTSVDVTCPAVENKTPLMFVIENMDKESIRLLCRAGASLDLRNARGFNAREIADATGDAGIVQALYPEEEDMKRWKVSSIIMAVLLYIVTWTSDAALRTYEWVSGLSRNMIRQLDEVRNQRNRCAHTFGVSATNKFFQSINGDDEPDKNQFVENVGNFVDKNPALSNFFKDKPYYIKELTKKVADLEQDTSTCLGGPDLLPKTVQVSLHQQVIYCGKYPEDDGAKFVHTILIFPMLVWVVIGSDIDRADDSASMKRDDRWKAQSLLVSKIAEITTRILPVGEGVALRFINQNVDESSNLALGDIQSIMEGMSWAPKGNTEIGRYLKSKILEPLVYSKLGGVGLERPLLISIITDGVPSKESPTALLEALVECGDKLQRAGLPRDSECAHSDPSLR